MVQQHFLQKDSGIEKYFINSGIVGFLVSGLLINFFYIYAALVFHEGDYYINKVLFIICGILLWAFLVKKIINVFKRIKYGACTIGKILKEMFITILFSVLWIIFFFIILEIADVMFYKLALNS